MGEIMTSPAMQLLEDKFKEKHDHFMDSMLKLGNGQIVDKESMKDDMFRVSGALAMINELMVELERIENKEFRNESQIEPTVMIKME